MFRQVKNAKQKQLARRKPWRAIFYRKARSGISLFSVIMALAATGTARATIDNAATASGSYDGKVVKTRAVVLEIPVEPGTAALQVSQSAVLDVTGGEDAENADAGDTLVVTLSVTNSGNITLRDVRPANKSVVSDGTAGTGGFAVAKPASAGEIAPGGSQDFTLIYTLSAEDVYRAAGKENALSVKLAAAGSGPAGDVTAQADDVMVPIAANPGLSIAKDATISKAEGNRGSDAEAGDLVTYTYTVTNTGNVPIEAVAIADEHEGVVLSSAEVESADEGPFDETETTADPLGISADESANGVWDVLGAGGSVTFTYRHTVTQAEFEAQ